MWPTPCFHAALGRAGHRKGRNGCMSHIPLSITEHVSRMAALTSEYRNTSSPCLEKVNFPKCLGKSKALELLLIDRDSWEKACCIH